MPKKRESIKFKNYERKIESPFTIYAYFESNLVPENNRKKIQGEPYTCNIKNILLAASFIY